jgi:hypothetical protein
MIKILVENKNDLINHIIIKGHAEYGTKGNDIVCASVSSITITSLNVIIRIDKEAISFDQSEGFIEVNINKHDKYIDIILENMISLLEELKKQYEKNIKIDRR